LSPVLAVLLPYANNDWIVYSFSFGADEWAKSHDADVMLIAVLRNGTLLHPRMDLDLIHSWFGFRKFSQVTLIAV
jgi:hypothetical protein